MKRIYTNSKELFMSTIMIVVITSILIYAVTLPMSRSEASSILSQTGELELTKDTLTYHTDPSISTIELEALYILSEYDTVNLIIDN